MDMASKPSLYLYSLIVEHKLLTLSRLASSASDDRIKPATKMHTNFFILFNWDICQTKSSGPFFAAATMMTETVPFC